ncbi:MAG TPA: class I SAM-dependent methyltransferase, partial [Vicinamibacteria bacterium]|nr:class I SAM-dependent methyltransferase [Vicinamibacteria bacterium]
MDQSEKRRPGQALHEVQDANQLWWTHHTMSYDWKSRIAAARFSPEWFDEADRRFLHDHRLFAHDQRPFGRIIPFERLAGTRVLEIGCGMGLHTEHIARAGADITAIDISPTSVAATARWLAMKGVAGEVRQMDAQAMEFPDESFDFVWSWGVIHHSAMTGRIVREIHRVLRAGGEVRVMVYNLAGMSAYVTLARRYILGFWRGRSLDECLWRDSDGFTARYYTEDHLRDLFHTFFAATEVETFGQDADGLPLPGVLRRPLLRFIDPEKLACRANRRGAFLFLKAVKAAEAASVLPGRARMLESHHPP